MTSKPGDRKVSDDSALVEDSVPRANDELAVGADLEFQKASWRFERGVWILFGLIVAISATGLLGRGPLARAQAQSADGAISVDYERIQHIATSSRIEVHLSPASSSSNHVGLWIDAALLTKAGLQSVQPQPQTSIVGPDGTAMVFAVSALPITVNLAIKPETVGVQNLHMRTAGGAEAIARLLVLP